MARPHRPARASSPTCPAPARRPGFRSRRTSSSSRGTASRPAAAGTTSAPAIPVTPWQILVWMSKTPAVPGGVAWGAVYHPVPRGAIYTLRDEQNRVVTEMTDASSGSASAALSVSRNNVFLGNLLVASSTPTGLELRRLGPHRKHSSALGRAGNLTESHRFWPYGEDTNTVAAEPAPVVPGHGAQRRRRAALRPRADAAVQPGEVLEHGSLRRHRSDPQCVEPLYVRWGNPLRWSIPNGLWTREIHERGSPETHSRG